MKIHISGRLFLLAAVLGVLAVFAAVFFVALSLRSVVAGPDAAPAAAPTPHNPGHPYDQIDLPEGTWPGLDADMLDGQDASAFASASHGHNAGDINAGTLDPAYYSAYSDLGADGYLDNEAGDLAQNNGTLQATLNADMLDGQEPGPGGGLIAGTLSRMGFSTTTVDSDGDVGQCASVAVGTDGLPVISYHDATNGDLKVAHCGNADCSAGNTITTVDSTDWVGTYTSVTVGADGLPLISYYDDSNYDLKVAHCGNADCSAGNTITTVDSTDQVGQFTSVTVGADGLPVISYYDGNGYLKVLWCSEADCSDTAHNVITLVDSTYYVGQFTSVTVGSDGKPLISYKDVANGDLKVAHCSTAACTAATITKVDGDTTNVGSYTSVTVGADGLPLISYYDDTNKDLKIVHCSKADCSDTLNNVITTVDGASPVTDVGQYTSVTVGADGLAVISYFDYTNWDLKVAHCGNATCSASTTTKVDGDTTNVGVLTSVTVGADGLPIIGYYDYTNFDLKVAHCSNRLCVPYHRPR
jgi:hypothetical protein